MHSSSWHIWDPEVLITWVAFWAVVLGGLSLRARLSDPTVVPQRWNALRRPTEVAVGVGVIMLLAVIKGPW